MAFSTTLVYTTGQTMTRAIYQAQISDNMDVANKFNIQFSLVGSLTSGVKPIRWIAPFACTVVDTNAALGTASTIGSSSGGAIFDILKTPATGSTAVTLFTSSSKFITLTSGIQGGTTTVSVPDVTAISSGDVLTIKVVDDGSTAAADATVIVSLTGA